MRRQSLEALHPPVRKCRPGCLSLCFSIASALLISDICIAQTGSATDNEQLGDFISRVCPDGWDEDLRQDGPVVVLTGDWRGGGISDYAPAFRTPFVLYGDGTVIAGTILYREGTFAGWRHVKYHLDPSAMAQLMRSLNLQTLLKGEDDLRPVEKEENRWVEEHHCFDACWPYLELHLWSEGCRKTISISGLDNIFMQYIALGIKPDLYRNDAERFAMAQLAFKRLPVGLRHALKRMGNFRLSGGTPWCKDDACQTKSLPWHESWGLRARVRATSSSFLDTTDGRRCILC